MLYEINSNPAQHISILVFRQAKSSASVRSRLKNRPTLLYILHGIIQMSLTLIQVYTIHIAGITLKTKKGYEK